MNFDRDPELAHKKLGSLLNPDNPDLSNFAKHGGKIIVYHGWADAIGPSEASVNYFDSVLKTLGGSKVNDFYRLFMVPGMAHCGGGPGADVLFQSEVTPHIPLTPERDMLSALERWVEKGEAPNKFVASRVEQDGTISRTRLVCSYPTVAVFSGTGDPAQAQKLGVLEVVGKAFLEGFVGRIAASFRLSQTGNYAAAQRINGPIQWSQHECCHRRVLQRS